MQKAAIVVHSGGMDSSLCLALAKSEFGRTNLLSLSFDYGQRHAAELSRAKRICQAWGVDHCVLPIHCLAQITENSLTRHDLPIDHQPDCPPNSLVIGRNGLMARLAAIHASTLGAACIYMGIIEVESANSGYRDCSRNYMDRMEDILRVDLDQPQFEIRTPIVAMTKYETMELGAELGVLEYLLDTTITCYRRLPHAGCTACPACRLRNDGLRQFRERHPDFPIPFSIPSS